MSPRHAAVELLIKRLTDGETVRSSEKINNYPVAKLICDAKERGLVIFSRQKKIPKTQHAPDWRLHLVGRFVEYKLKEPKQ